LIADPHQLTARLTACAYAQGFEVAGVCAPAAGLTELAHWQEWQDKQLQASLAYLTRDPLQRLEATSLLPGCQSVIVLAMSCRQLLPAAERRLPVADYACGDDYHQVLRQAAEQVAEWLHIELPGSMSKVLVDTAPFAEKAFAVAAGVGWQGRHTLVLNANQGSYLLLACILTTADLAKDEVLHVGCGSCRRCIDACPTGALHYPGYLDIRSCLSYLTTVRNAELTSSLELHGWFYGCDDCQQACPFNAKLLPTSQPRFSARKELLAVQPAEFECASDSELMKLLSGTVLEQHGLERLRMQARLVSSGLADHPAGPEHPDQQ
jgi:epoxyqueuosine reductase